MPKKLQLGALTIQKTSTSSAAAFSAWHDFGPCLANSITVGAAGITSPGKMTVQGALSTALSTAAIRALATRTSTNLTSTIQSTVAVVITRVRFRTTGSTAASVVQSLILAAGE